RSASAPPFPYTTLFRSEELVARAVVVKRPEREELSVGQKLGLGRIEAAEQVLLLRGFALRLAAEAPRVRLGGGHRSRLREAENRSEEHTSELQSRFDLV